MADLDTLGEADRKLYDKIAKLLQLASKNTNKEEAASAAAKAQELLTTYNLDVSFLEQQQGRVDGKREEAKVSGGFYKFQRELYGAVAEMNFCMYFTETYYVPRAKAGRRKTVNAWGDEQINVYAAGTPTKKHRHCVIGKQINTATTKVMASYLIEAIERIVRDRLRKSNGEVDQTQLLSQWATSFREGAAQNIIERVQEQQALDERKRRAAQAKAAREAEARNGKASTATGLTLMDVKKSEYAANYDFIYGEGAWERQETYAREAAAARKAHREKMARLAKEDPEAYRALEKEAMKGRRRSYGRSERERPKDWSAYNAGHEAGKSISLHRQADAPTAAARLGGK